MVELTSFEHRNLRMIDGSLPQRRKKVATPAKRSRQPSDPERNMILSLVEDSRSINSPGFDVIAGLGKQANVGYGELIQELSRRGTTRAIALYKEGFLDGRGFLSSASQVAPTCPIAMLRGGRSTEGRQAAPSHTGSIAGADDVAQKVLFRWA